MKIFLKKGKIIIIFLCQYSIDQLIIFFYIKIKISLLFQKTFIIINKY